MSLWTKTIKPDWTWKAQATEFLADELEGYLNPHTGTSLMDIEDLIPSRYHKHIFLAGGFAACVAGITKEYRDVDIFCDSVSTFDKLLDVLQSNPRVITVVDVVTHDGYGRLFKFKVDEQKFDLIDVTPETGDESDVIDILMSFDVNWCMAAIALDKIRKIWVHPEAFSETPRVNLDRIKFFEGTQLRLKKYSERLVRNVDAKYVARLIEELPSRVRGKQANDWDS